MKKRILVFITIFIFIVVTSASYPLFLTAFAKNLIVSDKLKPADIIIVPSGDDNGERVNSAVKLYKQGLASKILMSGGPLQWRLTSATWMKKHAMALGVPEKDILLEEKSDSTIDNANFCLPIVKKQGAKSVILVTSPTHTRRAKRTYKRVFSKHKIDVMMHSVPLTDSEFKLEAWWKSHEDTQKVLWEYGSLMFYFLKGY
ncbi:MAG: YdcF family protein [Candidatus Margulisbacteria bacterium]|nr:YdcF family protein [Candidatus Margulisiibacteriota bacterium]